MRSLLVAFIVTASALGVQAENPTRPNVVLIYADDLCYSENNLCEPHDISPRP
jgi:hypothetical protein